MISAQRSYQRFNHSKYDFITLQRILSNPCFTQKHVWLRVHSQSKEFIVVLLAVWSKIHLMTGCATDQMEHMGYNYYEFFISDKALCDIVYFSIEGGNYQIWRCSAKFAPNVQNRTDKSKVFST